MKNPPAPLDKSIARLTHGVFTVMFTTSVCFTLQGALLTDIINHYRLEGAMQGVLNIFQSVGDLLSLLITLWAAGRLPKPAMMAVICALLLLSMLGAAMQLPLYLFAACYFLLGMAKGLGNTATSSAMADLHPGRASANYIGALHGVFGVGGLASPLFAVTLKAAGVSWSGVYLAFAGVTALSLVVYMADYVTTKRPLAHIFNHDPLVNVSVVKDFLRPKRNQLLLCAMGCFAIYQSGYSLWINRYVDVTLHDPAMGALAQALFWVGTALSRIFFPHIRMRVIHIIIWGNISAGVFGIMGICSQSAAAAVSCSALAGLGSGAVLSMLVYMGCAWFKENTLFATVALFFVFSAGQMLSSPMIGQISALWSMPVGMTAAMLCAFLSALFALPLRKEAL